MMIKVFGKWFNPNMVLGLLDDKKGNTRITLPIHDNIGQIRLASIYIEGKTPDEVGEEINKQITKKR